MSLEINACSLRRFPVRIRLLQNFHKSQRGCSAKTIFPVFHLEQQNTLNWPNSFWVKRLHRNQFHIKHEPLLPFVKLDTSLRDITISEAFHIVQPYHL